MAPAEQLLLPALRPRVEDGPQMRSTDIHAQLAAFREFGKKTLVTTIPGDPAGVPVYVNEFWTARQRAASSLHEISYRACYKPQLPRFFIERLSEPGDTVYDPFMGRGTTLLEAAFLGRRPIGCDINPLSRILVGPRLAPPSLAEIAARLEQIDLSAHHPGGPEELLVFYHPGTLSQILNLRADLLARESGLRGDAVTAWIRMVATNRLTGHSPGFFSVYTLPPNQALSADSQRRINAARNQTPPLRDIKKIILKKSRTLLNKVEPHHWHRLAEFGTQATTLTASCDNTPEIGDNTVHLAVTSPPFLDVVDYQGDNWLRCWFNGIDARGVDIWQLRKPGQWQERMTAVLRQLRRVLVPGGHVAFEVGEVRGGKLMLETLVIPAAIQAGLEPVLVLINDQTFTKTSNCWGVDNLKKGTNTNRIVLLRKES